MSLMLLAVGAGCIWHGAQIIWVAPVPSLFDSAATKPPPDSPQAFQVFWLDQYAWIGIALVGLGVVLLGVVFLGVELLGVGALT